ncbi:MAG TPA: hypothetical protein VK608_08055, partial [Edaphobacter sp.]|nr:hypothetical protein [Edaphobacter sp.]
MSILHESPVYLADAGVASPDPSHPEIRWGCPRNLNLGRFGLIAPANFKLPTMPFDGKYGFSEETLLATAPKLRHIGRTIEEGAFMLRIVGRVAVVLSVVSLSAFAASGDCGSIIKLRQRNKNGQTQIDGRNSSGKPIVAYVVVDAPKAPQDYRTFTFHGLFTNGDSMRPGSSMNLGSLE